MFTLRVGAGDASQGLQTLIDLLARVDDPATQADVLRGISAAMNGRRQITMPAGWSSLYPKLQQSPNVEVRERSAALSILFGDDRAIAQLRAQIADPKADPDQRSRALIVLADAHDPGLGGMILSLLNDPAVRGPALQHLSSFNDPGAPAAVIDHYRDFTEPQKRDAVAALASRPAWGAALLDAVEAGRIAHSDLSAFTVRQLTGLHDAAVTQRLQKFYGSVRPPAKDKATLIRTYKKTFTPDMLAKADLAHGRTLFNKTCAGCHTLFDAGGKVGPELTGAQRGSTDYLLENIVDPSAVVAKDYYMSIIETHDGRTLTGIVKQETDSTLTLRDATAETTLPKSDVKSRRTSPISMMPEGLLEALSLTDARDLLGYLQSPVQVQAKE